MELNASSWAKDSSSLFLIAFLQVAQRVPNTDVNLFSFMSCFLFPQPGFSYRASFWIYYTSVCWEMNHFIVRICGKQWKNGSFFERLLNGTASGRRADKQRNSIAYLQWLTVRKWSFWRVLVFLWTDNRQWKIGAGQREYRRPSL